MCSLQDLRHPPGCCFFSRDLSSRMIPVCTLKDLRHPPAVETFHACVPSFHFFHVWLFLFVEHQILDTGYDVRVVSFILFVLFFVLFSYFCWHVLSCVLFGGESLLPPCPPRVGAME